MTDRNDHTKQSAIKAPTEAQRRAIAHQHGEMVVLAGAGSGKTATLAERCAALVTRGSEPCDVRELLVLTFTREAADEMRSRIAMAIRQAGGQNDHPFRFRLNEQAALADTAQISTFHAFCNWVAKTWFLCCRVDPGFTLLNEHQSALLQTDAIREAARTFMAADHPQHREFMEVFDLYAGAAPEKLETLIWPVLRTMDTVVDPDAWSRDAAEAGDHEVRKTIEAFIGQKQRRLDELALMLAANAQEAKLFDADKKRAMYEGLLSAATAARDAAAELGKPIASAWQAARTILAAAAFAKQIRLTDALDRTEADHFKTGTYQPLKEAFTDLCNELAASDTETLLFLEAASRRRIGTILTFVRTVRQVYQQLKAAQEQLDYSDLERTVMTALSAPDNALRAMLHRRFRHILVDEYQDINPVQQRLIELLYRGEQPMGGLTSGSLFGVGDVLQSIYGFRGSEPRILHDKVATLKQHGNEAHVITMRENFRTLPLLVDALNAIILPMLQMVEQNSISAGIPMAALAELHHGRKLGGPNEYAGIPVELHVLIKSDQESHGNGDSVESAAVPDMNDPIAEMQADELEAARIGELILEMRRSDGISGPEPRRTEFEDIAILLRAPSRRAPHYVRILNAMGIAANAALTTGFFDSSEVLEVLDILRVLDNPAQDIALAGVLLGPIGGCAVAELALVRKAVNGHIPFYQAVETFVSSADRDPAHQAAAEKITGALATLERWRSLLRTETLVNGLARIMREAGLLNRAAALPGGHQRLANLRLLQQRALEFSGSDLQSLSRFLNFIERLQDERDLGEAAPPAGNAVRIMSIHGSKGLEFPVVFVAGLGTSFNKRDLQQRLLVDREKGIGIKVLDDNGVLAHDSPGRAILAEEKWDRLIQEEARLLYVAMTRARDRLVLVGRAAESTVEQWSGIPLPGSSNHHKQLTKSANCPLAWLGPIFSQYRNTPDQNANPPLLALHLISENAVMNHRNDAGGHASEISPNAAAATNAGDIGTSAGDDERLTTMFNRITKPYAFTALTRLPAVASVSRLKSLGHDDFESPALILDAPSPGIDSDGTGKNSGLALGLIMHRVMQRLDLTHTGSEKLLVEALTELRTLGYLSAEEMTLVDRQALLWFFATPLGQRLRTVAQKSGQHHQVRREISFLWSMPALNLRLNGVAATGNPAVHEAIKQPAGLAEQLEPMLIRGTIDALLIEPDNIEVVDYKTDAPELIAQRLAAYRQQVGYYAKAASDILKKPVQRTSLVFFSARRIDVQTLP